MKILTTNKRANDLVDLYFENKLRIAAQEQQNKDILEELARITGGEPAQIGTRKLTFTRKKGSVSYAKIVKEHLPKLDLEKYRGKPSEYWSLS